MADLAAIGFVVILVILVVILITHFQTKGKVPGHTVSVWATNPNERPIRIGFSKVEDPNFMDEIERIRSEGYMKLAALNSGRREKNWRLEEHTGE